MDWSNPTKDTLYLDVLTALKERDVDALTLCYVEPTNKPTGTIRYNRASNRFEQWNGSSWVTLVLSVSGGGTGASDAATARTNLGLGSIATQNSNAVTVTGGTIAGLTGLTLACSVIMGNNQYDLGSGSNRVRVGYFGTGFVLPVGTDKYVAA